ncbi:hypothetical protein K443DRAFT_102932, partial [Laccaria amethystina LaAM-08-1]
KFLLAFYVLGLSLTEIASGVTSRVYETSCLTVQIRHSVLWGNTVQYQKFKLTSKFILGLYVLRLYLTGISPEFTLSVYET